MTGVRLFIWMAKFTQTRTRSTSQCIISMSKELEDKRKLQYKVERLLKKIEGEEKKKINSTDTESVMTKGRQGSHAGYIMHR
jgi:uncharacterized protein YlxW (UPF0749 family)